MKYSTRIRYSTSGNYIEKFYRCAGSMLAISKNFNCNSRAKFARS